MPMDEADFASLLEREPQKDDGYGFSPTREGWVDRVNAQLCRAERAEKALALAQKTTESQAARIKSLEDVLVAIRARLASYLLATDEEDTLRSAIDLIVETLDPCKPWCVLAEEGKRHEGACVAADEGDHGD